jgi:small subunit ribosomal protein S19
MTRSLKKGPFVDLSILKLQNGSNIWSRRSMVLPQHVGLTMKLHTGKVFLTIRIREDMVGHKFGEFASTRKKAIHKKKIKK